MTSDIIPIEVEEKSVDLNRLKDICSEENNLSIKDKVFFTVLKLYPMGIIPLDTMKDIIGDEEDMIKHLIHLKKIKIIEITKKAVRFIPWNRRKRKIIPRNFVRMCISRSMWSWYEERYEEKYEKNIFNTIVESFRHFIVGDKKNVI